MSVTARVKFNDDKSRNSRIPKHLLDKTRKELLRYTLEESSDRNTYDSKSHSMSVQIQIVSPVLRSHTPRQIVKRMNDVMKYSPSRKCEAMAGPLSVKKSQQDMKEKESFRSLKKVGIAQKKLQHHAQVTGADFVQGNSQIETQHTSPDSALTSPSTFTSKIREFFDKKSDSLRQRQKNALIYVRNLALDLKEKLRSTPVGYKATWSPTPHSSKLEQKKESYLSLCCPGAGIHSAVSKTPGLSMEADKEDRQLSAMTKLKLIGTPVKRIENTENSSSKANSLHEKAGTPVLKRQEMQVRAGQQKEAKEHSTFFLNMEKLAFEHIVGANK